MKLKYKFCFQQLGNTYMAVAVGDGAKQFNGMLQLDETGNEIVSRLVTDTSREKLIDDLLTVYSSDRAKVAGYVDEVLEYLKQEGVLEL